MDNTTAMAYINNMGGVRVDYLQADGEKLWDWCEKRRLKKHYPLASKLTLVAAMLSAKLLNDEGHQRIRRHNDTSVGRFNH
ncbi:hypothetical protein DMN91_008750 [Ooceraea biroi]|uniref:Uncharacterized protein n=1 Tax=Ooceraea biroi TaxID=2015173 RepID=A0A3L8DE12_OOCBI|nr:hypothetical protein DMN91_008750 [Ooceraea biroi]